MSGKRKFATKDGRVVDEGDPEAAFLVAGEGDEVDKEFVARLKDAAEKAAPKAAAKSDDKAVHKADNK